MRTFTQKEKWILNRIAELKKEKNMHSILLSDICMAFLKDELISINYSKKIKFYNISLFFDRKKYSVQENDIISKKQEEIEINTINTIFLLNYLKEQRLLFEISNKIKSDEFDIKSTKEGFQKSLKRSTNFDSMTRKMVVESLVNKRYFIKQEFIDFVNRDFRTPEEIRFKKSNIATWVSISIAFLIGFISILIAIKNSNSPVKINNEQFEKIDNSIKEINNTEKNALSFDSLRLNSISNILDTLNENIFSIKNNKVLEIDKNQYHNFESILIKTQEEIVDIKKILTNLSNDSIDKR